MNKKFKKLCSIALTLAITAASGMSMSVSSEYYDHSNFADSTIVDDKGLLECRGNYKGGEYKVFYVYSSIVKAMPWDSAIKFVLSEDVDYEEANKRIIEIFEEFYPDNYLGVSYSTSSEYEDYEKNFKPKLFSDTIDGVTVYTLMADLKMRYPDNEKMEAVKKYSKDFMKKLNDEKLISAFYDFGEVYANTDGIYEIDLIYSLDVDIDLIYKYIEEHNINCTVKKNDYQYELEFNDDASDLEKFLVAVGIYEETSIDVDDWYILEGGYCGDLFGKNSLEDLTEEPTEPATEATTEPTTTTTTTTEATTTTTTTTTTTEKATEPTTTTTTTTTEKATEPTTTTTTTTTEKATEPTTTTTTTTTEKATEPTTTTEATTSTTTTTEKATEQTTEATSQTTAATTAITTTTNIIGDANGDNKLDIRDAAFIAQKLAKRKVEINTEYKLESKTDELPAWADYNNDGVCDIRDAAAIARDLASKKIR